MLRRRLCLAALLALSLVSATGVRAAGVTMELVASFSGHYKYGEWLPVRVSLSNDGPALYAEVQADTTTSGGQTTYVAPVELPTGAHKQLTLYVRPPSFAKALRVRLVEVPSPGSKARNRAGEGRVLDTQSVPLTVEYNTTYLVGVIASRPQAFTILGGLTLNAASGEQVFKAPPQNPRPVKVIPLSLADLPERPEGLRVLDCLVISGADTSELTAGQGRALQSWVERGGRLIVGGGAGAARALAGLPAELVQAIRPVGEAVDLASLGGLGRFAGEDVSAPGPFSVAWPSGGQALAEQDGHALLVEVRAGKGRVNYSALDLAGSPFDEWAGAATFWKDLLTPGSVYPPGAPSDISSQAARVNSMSYPLQNLPALALPSIGWLAGLLAVYILLVGPLNYLVLRRLRRPGWAWVTIPTLTLLFSAGAFVFAYRVRGGDVILNQISVITFNPGAPGDMETFVGLFSPARRAYTLSFPGQSLVAPIAYEGNPLSLGGTAPYSGAEILQGEPAQVRGVQVDQWAMQGFYVESPGPEGWAIEADLAVEGQRIRGTVANHTSEVVADAVLLQGNRLVQLGNLPPGQTVTVDQPLSSSSTGQVFPYNLFEYKDFGPRGPSQEIQIRQQLLSNYFQSWGGPAQPPSYSTLIGWMHASPLQVEVAGARWASQQTSLVIAPLDVRYAPGPIHLAPGDLVAQIVDTEGNVGNCGPGNQLYLVTGRAVLEYQLPEALACMSVSRLAIMVQGGGGGMPDLEVADRQGEWVKIGRAKGGRNELPDPSRFVTPGGALRLRLSEEADNSMGPPCLTYDLDVEGALAPGPSGG